jgi:hypothetical protein
VCAWVLSPVQRLLIGLQSPGDVGVSRFSPHESQDVSDVISMGRGVFLFFYSSTEASGRSTAGDVGVWDFLMSQPDVDMRIQVHSYHWSLIEISNDCDRLGSVPTLYNESQHFIHSNTQ